MGWLSWLCPKASVFGKRKAPKVFDPYEVHAQTGDYGTHISARKGRAAEVVALLDGTVATLEPSLFNLRLETVVHCAAMVRHCVV